MRNFETQRGFTLAELAISVVVMGILVAGALAARSWVDNAKVVSTISQVQSYTNAVAQFRRLYVSAPGDLFRAGLRLPGCPGVNGAACNPAEGPLSGTLLYYDQFSNPTATVGDGKIGDPLWNVAWGAPATTSTGGLSGGVGADDERYLFWAHLLLANLISGVTPDGLYNSVPLSNGVTNPGTATGGGFVVGYSVPGISPALTPKGPGAIQEAPAVSGVAGMIIVQVMDPKLALQTTSGSLPLTPERAAQIDRKVDDGLPGRGFVQAYGVSASCFASIPTLTTTSWVYDERLNGRDCGLIYRLSY